MIPPDDTTTTHTIALSEQAATHTETNGQMVMPGIAGSPPAAPEKRGRGRPIGSKNKDAPTGLNRTGSKAQPGSCNPNAGRKPTPMINVPPVRGVLPSKVIDFEQVLYFAELQCTREEVAGFFRVDTDTIDRRLLTEFGLNYAEICKRVGGPAKISLRRYQFRQSENNATMAIWLGKVWLDQKDPDKASDLQRAQLDYATQAIKHAEQEIENLSAIPKTAASLSRVDSANQHLAGGSAKREDVQLDPQNDKAPEGRTEGGCVDCWRDAGLDPTQHSQ